MDGRTPTAMMLQDVISLVFSQLTLNVRDIFALRGICMTWRNIIQASTKRIGFEPGSRITTSMLRTLSQFSALFLDLTFTKFVFDENIAETLMGMDGLIGLDLSRVAGQDALCGYPKNLRSLRGVLYTGCLELPYLDGFYLGSGKRAKMKSETNSLLHLTRLQELTLAHLHTNCSFLSKLTTLQSLGIARDRKNVIDLNLSAPLLHLRTFQCSLDPRFLDVPMPCPLTQLLNLDADCDWKMHFLNGHLPLPEYYGMRAPMGSGKLTFPLSNYKLQSLSLSPLVLFPAPPDSNPNPFVNLTGLTSLTFHMHAFTTNNAMRIAPIDLCTCLAPLINLESFRLFYCEKNSLGSIGAYGRVSMAMIGRNFIPNEIVLTSFLHLHTLRAQFQSATILEALAHLEHLTKLSLPMLSHESTAAMQNDLAPLARLVSLRSLTLSSLFVAGEHWSPFSEDNSRLRNALLTDSKFRAVNYDFLASLTNLRSLDLTDRGIPDAALVHMSKLPFLWRLKLGCTNLSDESMALLKNPQYFASLRKLIHTSSFNKNTRNMQSFFNSEPDYVNRE
jgi:hypothetical protein